MAFLVLRVLCANDSRAYFASTEVMKSPNILLFTLSSGNRFEAVREFFVIVMANPKTTLYVGGLEENVTEGVLHAAFIPFGDVKDVSMPLDQATQKHRGFAFVTYMEKEDAAAAMDNMHNAELYGRVLTVNYAQPIKIKGGEQGWASQPVWADADTWFERQQQEEELQKLQAEHDARVKAAEEEERKLIAAAKDVEVEEDGGDDPMAQVEAEAIAQESTQ